MRVSAFQWYQDLGVTYRVFLTKYSSECSLSHSNPIVWYFQLSTNSQFYFLHIRTILYVDSTQTRPLITNKTLLNHGQCPALPTLLQVTPVIHAPWKGDGKIWLLASAGIAIIAVAISQPRWLGQGQVHWIGGANDVPRPSCPQERWKTRIN